MTNPWSSQGVKQKASSATTSQVASSGPSKCLFSYVRLSFFVLLGAVVLLFLVINIFHGALVHEVQHRRNSVKSAARQLSVLPFKLRNYSSKPLRPVWERRIEELVQVESNEMESILRTTEALLSRIPKNFSLLTLEGDEAFARVDAGEDSLAGGPRWLYENFDLELDYCSRPQGCALLVEATTHYSHRGPTPVLFRGAPWRPFIGEWLQQNQRLEANVSLQERRYGKLCPGNCNSRGTCDHQMGVCRCTSGWKGDACDEDDLYPCNREATQALKFGPFIRSMCAATCDNRTAKCFCGPETEHPGRPVSEPHGLYYMDETQDLRRPDPALITGKSTSEPGWCEANVEDVWEQKSSVPLTDYCIYDGYEGTLCDVRFQQYCVNQCSLRGECLQGFCLCNEGWYGIDCSIPMAGIGEKKSTQEPGGRVKAEAVGGATEAVFRKRPLVYVYELPPELNVHYLQRRHFMDSCVPRRYNGMNGSLQTTYSFSAEMLIFEEFLRSEHRTTNADEADYFFVPVIGGCITMSGHERNPRLHKQIEEEFLSKHPYLATHHYLLAYKHIQSTYPFWDRYGGRDHIWVQVFDEGACGLPKEIRNSIFLVHWGNTARQPKCTSPFPNDNWEAIPRDIRGQGPCYDPAKDLVIPGTKPLNWERLQQWTSNSSIETRPLLFHFVGKAGHTSTGRQYSWGIRQRVMQYFSSEHNISAGSEYGSRYDHDVLVGKQDPAPRHELLMKSRFCGVFPAHAWVGRLEEALLHGCIPVIIQDGVHMAFENVLHYRSFAVRITEADIPNMVKILRAIPAKEVRRKLENIKVIWKRFTYLRNILHEVSRQKQLGRPVDDPLKWLPQLADPGDDAMSTIFQVLHYKLYNDRWRWNERS